MDALERRQRLFRDRTGRRPGGAASRGRGLLLLGSILFLSLGLAEACAEVQPSVDFSAEITPIVLRDLNAAHVPGAVILVGEHGGTVYRRAFGMRALEPRPARLRPDDIFDLASLTKVVATTTAVMQLVEQGRVQLDAPAAAYWPAFAANGKGAITVRQLLIHTSGLAPDLDLAQAWNGQDEGLARAAAAKPVHRPGAAFVYSDINFIVLGAIVARVSGKSLDAYVDEHVFRPLRMTATGFNPPASKQDRIVATEREEGQLRWGAVQDPTAYRMQGVAGHAGLFSTADDLARFAQMLLDGGQLSGVRVLQPETVALMTQPELLPGGARRGLGWDMGSAYSQGLDQAFGPSSFGHTGYTGCMIWIDPDSRSYLIILTSRLHPAGRGDVRPLRRDLGRLVGALSHAETNSTMVDASANHF